MINLKHEGLVASDFELDINVVNGAPFVAALMRDTSDNCGSTCPSACASGGGKVG
ncbi:hypothetical protein GCM10010124_02510 [Pilimelia terevasa]|uniref:FxLD family lantipeptide n=1 Tax=Pilimelia terevasa TaxID=53372 RepID=A0A8J3BM14_9ACTN|nr:FxLD family lanthipeptide [Pilimelia terevasa]GGK13446.1 hypothetical protein GCM10010124_02510 [Pilimelia terevasa]